MFALRAKGLDERVVINKHARKNALILATVSGQTIIGLPGSDCRDILIVPIRVYVFGSSTAGLCLHYGRDSILRVYTGFRKPDSGYFLCLYYLGELVMNRNSTHIPGDYRPILLLF